MGFLASKRTVCCAGALFFSFLMYVFYYYYQSQHPLQLFTAPPDPLKPDEVNRVKSLNRPETILNTKLILLYTTLFGRQGLGGWWIKNTSFENCPFKCGVTTDRSLKHLSDAIVFHAHAEDDIDSSLPLPHSREKPDQVWVFNLQESPANSRRINLHKYDGHINWTITYRRDSDIVRPYGRLLPGPTTNIKLPTLESIDAKKGLVVALISNCEKKSGRQNLIKKLAQYIPVDYYGGCGNLTCARHQECYQELSQKYKFWLSFENSICEDYVTEKFFYPLQYGAVPVVYGGANYSAIAPSKSFINVLDFKTVKDLADHLLRLDRNPSEYLEYFSWMKDFHVASSNITLTCDLCTKLHSINSTTKRKSYSNFEHWFKSTIDGTGDSCKTVGPETAFGINLI